LAVHGAAFVGTRALGSGESRETRDGRLPITATPSAPPTCSATALEADPKLLLGATTFTGISRGLPRIPRATLSSRLASLAAAGIVDTSAGGYRLTESGLALSGVIRELARWATVADAAALTAEDIDTAALTWDIQRRINVEALPGRLVVLEIEFTVIMEHRRRWWSGRAGGSGLTRRAVSPSLRSGDRTGRSAWAARAPGRRRTPHDRLRPRGGRSGRRSPGRSHLGSRVPWSSPRYRVARRPCNCFTGAGGLTE
jgi:hypothetical protein